MDRLEAILHEFIEDGKQLSKDTARSMEQTNKRLESLGIAQDRAAEDRLELRADMQNLAKIVENLCTAQGQAAEDRPALRVSMESLARTVERTSQIVDNLGITRDQDEEIELRLKVRMDSLARTVDRTNRTMENLGIIQGQVAEDLFYRNLPSAYPQETPGILTEPLSSERNVQIDPSHSRPGVIA